MLQLLFVLIQIPLLLPPLFWWQESFNNLSDYFCLLNIIMILLNLFGFKKNKLTKTIFLTFYLSASLIYIGQISHLIWPNTPVTDSPTNLKVYQIQLDREPKTSLINHQLEQQKPNIVIINNFNNSSINLSNHSHQIVHGDTLIASNIKFRILKKSDQKFNYSYLEFKQADKEIFYLISFAANFINSRQDNYLNRKSCRRLANIVRNNSKKYIISLANNATPYSSCYKWFINTNHIRDDSSLSGYHKTWDNKNRLFYFKLSHIFSSEKFDITGYNILNSENAHLPQLSSYHLKSYDPSF